MTSKLEREVRFLKAYTVAATLLLAVLGLSAFRQSQNKPKFEEIDVERINIVEKDGKLRMVISNRARQHPGIVDGKTIPREDGRAPGLPFFNEKGDECGGLTFDGSQKDGHFASLTFDKFRQDQTVGFRHLEDDNGKYFAGLEVWDRPDSSIGETIAKFGAIEKMPAGPDREAAMNALRAKGEFGTQRVMVGKTRDKSAMITLSDPNGKPRIRISVDATGTPKLDFMDESGNVTYTLPQVIKDTKK